MAKYVVPPAAMRVQFHQLEPTRKADASARAHNLGRGIEVVVEPVQEKRQHRDAPVLGSGGKDAMLSETSGGCAKW